MMQLDYQTRGRAMFGVGPGSLVYDADKMGLEGGGPAAQARRVARRHRGADAGRMVTKKTDWFDLREARLQLPSYSQPMMEMAVASARSPTGARAGRQARHRHALDRRHVGRRAQGARGELGRLRGGRAQERQDARTAASGASSRSRMWRRRASRRCADVKFGLADFNRYFNEVATFPIIPPEVTGDPAEYLVVVGARLHRHARGLRAPLRAAVEGLERRPRRHPAARAQLGRLGGDAALLRTDGALRAPALPAQRAMRCATRATTTRRRKRATAGMEMQKAVQAAIDKYQAGKG